LGSAWVGGGCVKVTTHQAGEGWLMTSANATDVVCEIPKSL
jgi:hypothetical protein